MKSIPDKIYRFAVRFVRAAALLLTGALFLSGFLTTCQATDMETQTVLYRWDNPLYSVPGVLIALAILWGFRALTADRAARCKKVLAALVTVWILVLGCALILFGRTVPAADAMSVYSAAECLARGDTSVIHPTDSYLSYYPQQIGLVAFLEPLIRLWNLLPIEMPAWHFLKGVYVLLLCAAVFFQYKCVHLLWQDDVTDCLYLLLAGANLPMIMYSSFVYGEIPSFAAFSAGLYCLFRFLASPRWQSGLSALILFTLSVMTRKNSLILMIAVVLVLLFEWLKTGRHSLLALAVLCSVLSCGVLPLVQTCYELRADSTLKSGVPATSYLAMGMQESSRGCGWYNGFNFNTYQSTGMDTDRTNELSRAAIRERADYFRDNPGYAADFYARKYLSQWADGTYASRQATLATFGGRSALFDSLYVGDLSRYFVEYANLWQNLLYLGAFLFCIGQIRRPASDRRARPHAPGMAPEPPLTGLATCTGLIAVIGGFLFHMMWEANSRYIFVYSLLLMPYAARGIHSLLDAVAARIRARRAAPRAAASPKA